MNKKGEEHPYFLPAISKTSKKVINKEIRSWHIQLKSDASLSALSKMFYPILTGWSIYYGRFYPSALNIIWQNFNEYLVRWVCRKYKGFAKHKQRARNYLNRIARANPYLFVHWKRKTFPGGEVVGAV